MPLRLPFIPTPEPLHRLEVELAPEWRMRARDGLFSLEAGARGPSPVHSARRVAWCSEPPFDRGLESAYGYALRELNAAPVDLSTMGGAPIGGVLFLASVPLEAEIARPIRIEIPTAQLLQPASDRIACASDHFTWGGHRAFLWILWCVDCRRRHLADELCPFCVGLRPA